MNVGILQHYMRTGFNLFLLIGAKILITVFRFDEQILTGTRILLIFESCFWLFSFLFLYSVEDMNHFNGKNLILQFMLCSVS